MSLRIEKIEPTGKTFLSLEGTILIINENNRYAKSEVQVPVELITIYEDKKFRALYLIRALSFLFALLVSGPLLYGLIFWVFNIDPDGFAGKIFFIAFFPFILIGFVYFIILLNKFFKRRNTVTLVISPNNYAIEFWKDSDQAEEIDEFLNQIEYRKTLVEDSIVQPLEKSVEFGTQRTMIPQLIGSMVLLSLPAEIARNIKLLPIALIPLVWFIYNKMLAIRKVPKLLRQAIKLYSKEEWDKAINLLEILKEQFPEYLPSYTWLIWIYTRTQRYDEAMEVVSQLPNQYTDLANNITTDIWRYKRINQRRTEPIPENDTINKEE